MTKEEFINYCRELGVNITNELYVMLNKYYELLVEWNKKFNMTSILDKKQVFLLHFYDSICLSKVIDFNKECSLCDFGTGAGFPGMVIAILFNKVNVTLIESNQKKCKFLEYIKKEFNLKNVNVICSRIEVFGVENREIFDYVTCRAVTSLPIIIELSTSTLKVNGYLAPLKADCRDEIENFKLSELLKNFNLELIKVNNYNLPIQNANRMIPLFKKTAITSKKYPSNYSTIVKKYKKK